MMWHGLAALIASTSDAMLVDLPEPVGPQNSTRPCLSWISSWTAGGKPIWSTRRDRVLDVPQRDRGHAALVEGVAAEPEVVPREREVAVALALEFVALVVAEQLAR